MLKVLFGHDMAGQVELIDEYFRFAVDFDWFKDPVVVQMVKDIDNTKVVGPHLMESPVLGPIPPDMLSGGVKALILLYKEGVRINLTLLGENCAEWLLKIGGMRDLYVGYTGLHITMDGFWGTALCLNDGELIRSRDEWMDKVRDYVVNYDDGIWADERWLMNDV